MNEQENLEEKCFFFYIQPTNYYYQHQSFVDVDTERRKKTNRQRKNKSDN